MRLSRWFSALLLSAPFLATSVFADDYYPARGMSMKAVKAQYGEPYSVRQSAGPVKRQWPRITVWHYNGFSVYFERRTVLHTVVR